MKNTNHSLRSTDDQLMAQLDAGETEPAITILRHRYEAAVKKLVHKIVRDRHTTEDVVQDVFLKVFLKAHQYQIGTNFRAWLFGIARNQALNTLRNEPYGPEDGVTHTLKLHGLSNGVLNVMIEIRNDLVATPEACETVGAMLHGLIAEAIGDLKRQ